MMYKYDSLAIAWAVEYLLKNIYPCSDISRLSIMPSSMKQHYAQDCKKIVHLNNREYVREDMGLREEWEELEIL